MPALGLLLVALVAAILSRMIYGTFLNHLSLWSVFWLLPTSGAIWPTTAYGSLVSHDLVIVVYLASLGFLAGVLLLSILYPPTRFRAGSPLSKPTLRLNSRELAAAAIGARIALLIGLVALWIRFVQLGSPPLFDPARSEFLRRELRTSYLYNLYNLGKIGVPVLYSYYLMSTRPAFDRARLSRRRLYADVGLIALYVVSTVATGWRGDLLVLGAFIAAVWMLQRRGPRDAGRAVVVVGMGMVFFYLGAAARQLAVTIGDINPLSVYWEYLRLLSDRTFLAMPWYYLSPNYANLADIISGAEGMTLGRMTWQFVAHIPLWEVVSEPTVGGEWGLEVVARIQGRSYNVITYLGYLFVDFGVSGVVAGSAIVGGIATVSYHWVLNMRKLSMTSIVLWSSVVATLMFLPIGLLAGNAGFYYWVAYILAWEQVVGRTSSLWRRGAGIRVGVAEIGPGGSATTGR